MSEFIILRFDSVTSTQEIAKSIMKENVVIVARKMSGGYGRMRRKWHAPYGGLWLSVILKIRNDVTLMTLSSGVAVVESLKKFNITARLKWPNDVIYRGKKLCGILGEVYEGMAIIGIGVNLKNEIPDEIKDIAINIPYIDPDELLPVLLDEIEIWINKVSDEIVDKWKKHDMTIGKRVRVRDRSEIYEGIAKDIAQDGHLIISTESGERHIYTGDIKIIQISNSPSEHEEGSPD